MTTADAAPQDLTLVCSLDDLPPALTGGAVAIGNFDGVHRGHQAVLAAARAAAPPGGPVVALTFEPHPRQFFAPDKPLFRLTPLPLKARLLTAFGAAGVVALTFDAALAGLAAERFAAEVLAGRLGARHVAVGFDFHFGKGRGGTPETLTAFGQRLGFAVSIAPALRDAGEPISSSAIRAALGEGDIARANRFLGYPWMVEAPVEHGDKRGRTLGYPTANLRLAPETGLRHGIYAVRARIEGEWREGVASFGRRPTFGGGAPLLEVHLFDFAGDLYGRPMLVAFLGFLRPEARFDDAEALVRQMDRDGAAARDVLAAAPGPAPLPL